MPPDLSRQVPTSHGTISPKHTGPLPGLRISSKRVCRESLPSATCEAAISSAWHRPSAKDRSPSPLSIGCCMNDEARARQIGRKVVLHAVKRFLAWLGSWGRHRPPDSRDPYAWKPAIVKPRPKGRSGAVAVAEPDDR